MKPLRGVLWLVLASVPAVCPAQSTPLLDVLADELRRNFTTLRERGDVKPYYLSYSVTETTSAALGAQSGALQGAGKNRVRQLDIMLRLGGPEFDNYHLVRGQAARFTAGVPLPLDDSPNAIRRLAWIETDRVYRAAVQRLSNAKSDKEVTINEEKPAPDFAATKPNTAIVPVPAVTLDEKTWAPRLRRLSAEFGKYPEVISSTVAVQAIREVKSMVDSDGARLQHGRTFARLIVSANSKAPDGLDLQTGDTWDAESVAALPGDEAVLKSINRVAQEATQLVDAPALEPYVGPAIMAGRAAGVFFHEIFGHRIEGHRMRDLSDQQTFTKSLGQPVLPPFLNVVFDPTRKQLGSIALNGWYDYDDEGVQARPVMVVERGVLKTFLMSRLPLATIPASNGHGRRQPGLEPVSRQSNLIVESAKQVPEAELKKMLIAEVQRQGKPYGLYLKQVTGGYTQTQRRGIGAFKVLPLVVYRVYPDGREELVRGADIVGTPLASFAKILATGDRAEVFNGYCGAESGNVPVSAVSPAILVGELELQRREPSQERPPLLPRPNDRGGEE